MTTLQPAAPPLSPPAECPPPELEADEPRAFHFGPREHLVNLGFWTLFGAVTAANFLSNDFEPAGYRRAVPEAIYWFFQSYLWAAATPLLFWLAWRYGVPRGGRLGDAIRLVGAALCITLAISLLRDFVWERVLDFPPRSHLDLDGSTSGWRRLGTEPVMCAAILAAGLLRDHFGRSRAREERAMRLLARTAQAESHTAQLQAQLASARLAVLRSQLNPHFLFNSLNAVSTLMDEDRPGAQRMIARLSELLRHALAAREEEIPLRHELRLTRLYLEILEIRFAGRLSTRVSADPELLEALVPDLVLQPLVENAMKHGLGRVGGRGRIEVDVRRQGDSVLLSVSDTGGEEEGQAAEPGMEGSGTGLGLRNTRARLQELYGAHHRLQLVRGAGGGTVAEITLPYRPGRLEEGEEARRALAMEGDAHA